MKQFILKMNDDFQRPVFTLRKWYNFDAMFDTGALLPVWIGNEELLKGIGAALIKADVEFGGIGGKVMGKLYQIPYVTLGELVYPNMHILFYPMEMNGCHMLLSSTMFDHLRCELDYENRTLTVTIPDTESPVRDLRIYDDNGKLYVLCQSAEDKTEPEDKKAEGRKTGPLKIGVGKGRFKAPDNPDEYEDEAVAMLVESALS